MNIVGIAYRKTLYVAAMHDAGVITEWTDRRREVKANVQRCYCCWTMVVLVELEEENMVVGVGVDVGVVTCARNAAGYWCCH
jgi:hypothetical protein